MNAKTIAYLKENGAQEWNKKGNRIYLNTVVYKLMKLQVQRHNTGTISYAELNDEKISNSEASRIISAFLEARMYIDLDNGKIIANNTGDSYYNDMVKNIANQIYALDKTNY